MVGLALTYQVEDVQVYPDTKYKGSLPEDWIEVEQALQTQYVLFDHKTRVELQFDGLRQRLSFAEVSISDHPGLSLPEDRRYVLQEKCATLDEVMRQ